MNVTIDAIRAAVADLKFDGRRPDPVMAALSAVALAALKSEYDAKAVPIQTEIKELAERVKKAKQAYQSTPAEKRINELSRQLSPIDAQYAAVNRECYRREQQARYINDFLGNGRNLDNSILAMHPELLDSHGEAISRHRTQFERYAERTRAMEKVENGTAEPNERQLWIIAAIRKARDAKIFSSRDVRNFVIRDLPDLFTPEDIAAKSCNVEGGDTSMEIYYASRFIDKQNAKALELVARENFQIGKKFRRIAVGCMTYTSAVVEGVGDRIKLVGKRGGKTYTITAAAASIQIVAA